ncbi:MAG: class I SAM-dependent methyltransferase [Geminicoccaceae bacterium]
MPPPLRRHTDVLRETVTLAGRSVLDVGCGGGRLLGWLRREGAAPMGLDPGVAELARARAEAPGVPLVAGRGEALPFASGRFDLVLFFNSLHHVPLTLQWQALTEAARVLTAAGELLVVEPLPEGDHFALLRQLDDETEVRREAFRTLHAAGALSLRMAVEGFYRSRVVEPSWASVRQRFLAADPARAPLLAGLEPELERLFATLGEPAEGGRAFTQPMRLNLLRRR